ncbi:MAG: hypothetical protein QXO67_04390 [Candidatus Bathyarchaeia archaeon]
MPRGAWGKTRTSLLVRDHLIKVGKDSIYNTWKAVLKALEDKPYLKPTYSNIRILFYILRRLGLIRKVSTQPSSKKGFYSKHLYTVVKAKADSELWLNPYEALYRPSTFKKRMHLVFE